ncbi:MAG: trigger factor [Thermodesulfovibrionales bacterium]|nr:trigger factor [Thermodesulfovibrionales bacterium]
MLIAVEDISLTKKRLGIEIPSDIIEKEIKDSLERLRQKANIPGFRPGRAPINLIEKRFGKEVETEVLDKVIPEYYSRALKEADLKPVTMPSFDKRLDFKRNNPLNLSFTVEVMPKIENLNYENIKIKDIPIVVDEAEVEDYIKKLQYEKAIYEVAEKDVDMDDLVTFEYVDCKMIGEESPPSIKEQILKMGKEIFPLDIMERVIGKKKGEVVEFTTTFNEGCKSKELAGKTVDMKVMIKEIKRKILPAIDDEFAKDLGYENLQVLKENIKERLHNAKKEQAVKIQKAEILRKIIESHEFEVPEALLRNELESLMIQGTSDAHPTSEVSKPDPSELKEKALRNVRASIIIDAIGQKEEITVTEDEVKDRIHFIAERLSAKPEVVMKFYIARDGSLEGLRHSIYEDKVLDMLLSKAISEKGE